MFTARLCFSLLLALFCAARIPAQQGATTASSNAGGVVLNVVVTQKSGAPIGGLQQGDFTILDNKVPQTITSFKALNGRQAPIEIIVVLDAVNIDYQDVAFQRQQVDKFLKAGGGHLAYPTAVAILTDSGPQIQQELSNDGNELSSLLDQTMVALRTIRRSTGFYGAVERQDISTKGLQDLVAREAAAPGRKIILWISPGWPMLSGPGVEAQLDEKQYKQIFESIVSISTQLRQAGVTLYSIDPLGAAGFGPRTFYWESFLKAVTKPSQAEYGNLALQVIASQSGGLALNSSNDVTAELEKCVADMGTYYEILYDPGPGGQPREYHHVEVKVGKKGLTARTLQGYYAQP